jgi:LPXTG-site transpeptidase (sortase) family protein
MPRRSIDGVRLHVHRSTPVVVPELEVVAPTPEPAAAEPSAPVPEVVPAGVIQTRPKRRPNLHLPRFGVPLLYVAIVCYALILAVPFLPRLLSVARYSTITRQTPPEPQVRSLANVVNATPAPLISGPNRLSVASMGIEGEIHEGRGEETLDKGIWRRPQTSTPDKGSNTVLAAHRFQFTSGNNTFYNLDKVAIGDKLEIVWEGVRYVYTVTKTQEVLSRDIEIEGPTELPTLTLYTCTPLWTSEKRLVVSAVLDQ